MLADLLEKKSNPPVQIVQMTPQINAPTIQITETGQIVQVKPDPNPVIQINADSSMVTQAPYFQLKNDQIIQIKNEQGQIIQIKGDQIPPMLQFKNDQGQIVQIKSEGQIIQGSQMLQSGVIQGVVKTEKEQIVKTVVTDHSYTEPLAKKIKVEPKEVSTNTLSLTLGLRINSTPWQRVRPRNCHYFAPILMGKRAGTGTWQLLTL